MLVVDSTERKSCINVWRTLDQMYARCTRSEEYATMGNPWCNMRPIDPSPQPYITLASEEAIQESLWKPPLEAAAVQPVVPKRKRPSRIPRLASTSQRQIGWWKDEASQGEVQAVRVWCTKTVYSMCKGAILFTSITDSDVISCHLTFENYTSRPVSSRVHILTLRICSWKER